MAINFVTDRDIQSLEELKTFYNTQIEPMPQNIADYFCLKALKQSRIYSVKIFLVIINGSNLKYR